MRWTIYGCTHVRKGDFGAREWSLEPPKMSCAKCQEIEVVSASYTDSDVERVAEALWKTSLPVTDGETVEWEEYARAALDSFLKAP